MIEKNEIDIQINLLAESLTGFRTKRFNRKKITYVESTVREEISDLKYLISIDIIEKSLILGFSDDKNYLPTDKPTIYEKEQKGVTFREIKAKDNDKRTFLWIDFSVGHLLFVDRLSNGIALFKTNAHKEIDTMILKQRWIFREDITFNE
jgi:hypothetical protein